MNPAPNLLLIGPMGAGKSTIGRRLARRFELEFIDLDDWIEARSGASVGLIFELEGEAGFRQRESLLLAEAVAGTSRLIATGGGSVLAERNRALISAGGFVVYLRANVNEQLRRLARDQRRPLLRAPDREQRLRDLAEQRNPIYAGLADLSFEAGNASPERAARELAALIERNWQRPALIGSVA